MKKLLALLLAAMLVLSLAACGSGTAESNPPSEEPAAPSEEPAAPSEEPAAPSEAPAAGEWVEQVVTSYFFEATGEDVDMTIKTNADHSKYNFTFLFYGDEQDMTCTADGEVLDDLTGFIGKDAQNFLSFIAENITDSDWQAIGGGSGANNDSEWVEQVVTPYFFEATGEDVDLTIKTNADHSKYNFTFLFFGDEQDMTCTADGEVLADLTGFIGKDAQNFLTFISENISDSDWTAIG